MTALPRLTDRWLSESGGLIYHWRAWRYRAAWAAFNARVCDWLRQWVPPTTSLVLIGPSAGYTLAARFLARFDDITAIEPDPLARWLLRRRFAAAPLHFEPVDYLTHPAGLAHLAARHPQAALLFCNVLGQNVGAHAGTPLAHRVRRALHNHHWASYHDVLSAPQAPLHPLPATAPDTAAALAEQLWGGSGIEVCDHDTFGLGGSAGTLALWPLAPGQHHVIEWIVSTSG